MKAPKPKFFPGDIVVSVDDEEVYTVVSQRWCRRTKERRYTCKPHIPIFEGLDIHVVFEREDEIRLITKLDKALQ